MKADSKSRLGVQGPVLKAGRVLNIIVAGSNIA
ncbi:hypothetical protein HDC91_001648 [Mucilaginibacter sp. AK015]|nr:hypothetical protein [Mucilaginibacter sp. AK015]